MRHTLLLLVTSTARSFGLPGVDEVSKMGAANE